MAAESVAERVRRITPESVSAVPLLAVLLLVVTLPFHWQLRWDPVSINMSYGDGVVAVVGVLWLAGLLGARRLPSYATAIGAFFASAVVSVVVAWLLEPAYFSATAGLVELVKFAGAAAWAIAAFAVVREQPRRLVPVGAAASVLLSVGFATLSLYEAVVWDVVRPDGPFNNPNIFGNYLVCNACLALLVRDSWLGRRWPLVHWSAVLAVPLLVTAVVVTGSRGSMLAIAGATATIVLLYSRRVSTSRIVGGVAAIGTAMAAIVAALVYSGATFLTHLHQRLFKDLENRFEMWSVAAEAFRSSPLVGIGYGQLPGYMHLQTGREYAAHNVYMTIGAEVGLFGLVAFLGLLAWVLLDGWRLARTEPAVVFLAAVVGATAVQGIGTDVDNFRTLWIVVGLAGGYTAALHGDEFAPRERLRALRQWVARRRS